MASSTIRCKAIPACLQALCRAAMSVAEDAAMALKLAGEVTFPGLVLQLSVQ